MGFKGLQRNSGDFLAGLIYKARLETWEAMVTIVANTEKRSNA
jgi:hypothetical protein